MRLPVLPLACLAALLLSLPAPAADATLFDFSRAAAPPKHTAQDARVTLAGQPRALRVATGQAQEWPGVTLPLDPPRDLSPCARVAVRVRNLGKTRVTVHARVDNPGADGRNHCVTGSVALAPGQADTLVVPLKRTSDGTLGGQLFGMRGYPAVPGGPGTLDPARVSQILVFVSEPTEDHVFQVEDIRATGTYVPPTATTADASPYFPFLDTFGQYRHKDWPGKVHSAAELVERRKSEAAELAAKPGPAGWDEFGGWAAGPQLEATGFFRTQKVDGRWWLVDPRGRLFFSHGIDCVRMLDQTPVEERDAWFEDFPGRRPEFAPFLGRGRAIMGHYKDRSPETFSFAGANLLRKYGPDWRASCPDTIHLRLRAWGLNTIANWSDEAVFRLRRTPYTDQIGSQGARRIEGSEGYWGKFPDVFDPSFPASIRRAMAGKKGRSAGDPWCLGWFCDNEMSWGEELSAATAALKSPPTQAAKQAFLADLKAKYTTIDRLNAAWGTNHASWEALAESRAAPDPKKARGDLAAFATRLAETYFRTVRDTIREVAPQQLYLGCRFAWVNPRAAAAAAKFCDVVSYNLYQRDVGGFRMPGNPDVPLIIGEFHFGALDRGMFHTGLVPVSDQAARAKAYQDYVRGALRHPQFVGCHWFQYQDQPTTGRVLDGENYQIGFVDIADTPYKETVQACREVADTMYPLRQQNSHR